MNIKAVIFDIGGVLLDDPEFASFWQGKEESKLLRDSFGTGKMDINEFIMKGSELLQMSNSEFLTRYSSAYSGMHIDESVANIYQLINLPKYIFSDTNPIHYKFCQQNFSELFAAATEKFLSFEIMLRKDDIESYKYVLSRLDFNPEEILFIDNKVEYIQKAALVGITGLLYEKGMDLRKSILEIDRDIFR